jgi:hypothetical protein
MKKNDLRLGDDGEFTVDLDVQQKHDYQYDKRKTKSSKKYENLKRANDSSPNPVVTMLVSLITTIALLNVFVLVAMTVAYIILEV